MDNKPNFQPNLTLPPLGGETIPRNNHENLVNPEHYEASGDTSASNKQELPKLDFSAINFAPPASDTSQITTTSASHSVASSDDDSKLPKEWILKAKKIINSTRGNPREQSIAINQLKADYLRQRFDIELKVPKDE